MQKIQTPKSRKKTKSPVCETCKFMVAEGDHQFCHRYPPTALMKVDGAPYFTLPYVKIDWWCGEWRAKA
jgi:hypothetical protein